MIVSPSSAAANAALALAPRTPHPAAWKISAWVSVTAAGSATPPPRRLSHGRVGRRHFPGDEWPPKRRGERLLEIRVGRFQLRVPGCDIDRARYRPRGDGAMTPGPGR